MKLEAIIIALALSVAAANAQVKLSGSIQSDVLIPQEDEKIGTESYSEWALTNSYLDLKLQSKYVDAGARLEYLEHPLPGFEQDFKGWGVPHIYVKGHYKWAEITVGNFYEQFGSGFVLRTYEERSLGIDNSLLGGRVVLKPAQGVTIKALAGKQRRYWNLNHALVSGADVELNIDEWSKALQQSGTRVMIGGSLVNKHEGDDDEIFVDATHRLNLPKNVLAWDARATVQHGGLSVLAEYAQKSQDPSFDNGYVYRKGNVAMLSGSYSKRGMSVLVQAKRDDNMAFRSRRTMTGTSSYINHLPAFTHDHTYTLAALYPYATHPDGEWAYQAELGYNFKKKTPLGGKYGTKVGLNLSYVRSIEQGEIENSLAAGKLQGSDGRRSSFFKWGDDTYYQDLNLTIEKRITRDFRLNLMYMNQRFNKTAVEGEGGMIHSNIFIADGRYQFNPKTTLRCELQYLTTADDQGDWAFALAELSLAPHWMFTLSDLWNCGETDLHYYQGLVSYSLDAHRLQVGYGRTRAGYNCSGGVCRWVPASKGVTISYNYSF